MVGISCQPGVHNNLQVVYRSNSFIELAEIKQFVHFTHFMDNVVFVVQSINLYLDLIILPCQMPSSVRCNRNRK